MKKNIKLIAAVAVEILLFVGAYFLYDKLSEDYAPPVTIPESNASTVSQSDEQRDYSAPDFTVVDGDGNEVTLSQYIGKPIVLNFWASWCPPCKSEMPHFEEAYKANPDVQFLMVNVTASDDMASAKAFIEDEGYTFPVLYDTKGMAAYTYGASSLPMTIFIDRNGDLMTYAVGSLSAESLDKGIELIK